MDKEGAVTYKESKAHKLRKEILPISFDKAGQMDPQEKAREISSWTQKINTAFETFVEENGNTSTMDEQKRKNMDKVIGFTAKVLTEITEVLGVESNPEFEFFPDDDPNWNIWRPGIDNRVTHAHASGNKVGINIHAFWNLVERVRSSPYAEITTVPQTLGSLMAEEVGHIYISQKHPKVHERTVKANERSQRTKNNRFYDNDPGENALHEFSQDYAKYIASIREWPFK